MFISQRWGTRETKSIQALHLKISLKNGDVPPAARDRRSSTRMSQSVADNSWLDGSVIQGSTAIGDLHASCHMIKLKMVNCVSNT